MTLAFAPVEIPDTRAAWCERIVESWRESFEAVIRTGRLLAQARDALAHGEWMDMVETDLPFGISTAERLIKIAADPRIADSAHGPNLPPHWRTLYELTKLADAEFAEKLADGTINPDMTRADVAPGHVAAPMSDAEAGAGEGAGGPRAVDATMVKDREEGGGHKPNGARAIMSDRQEPDDSLDFFPTPPWATRALMEHVMPLLGVRKFHSVWEPACGEGHIAEVLREYFDEVDASDIHDYGYAGACRDDFLATTGDLDWIITNPPFGEKGEAFARHALGLAGVGVAMFFRLQFLETIGRYEDLFNPHPPALIAQFVERVPLHKGRWEPDGDTATAYLWIAWLKNETWRPSRFFWIPPGCRESLTRPDDVERFTQHPVRALPARVLEATKQDTKPAPAWISPLADAELTIPDFLRRTGKTAAADHTFTTSIDWRGAGGDNLGTNVALCSCGKELRVARGATPEANDVAREKFAEMMDEHKRAMGATTGATTGASEAA